MNMQNTNCCEGCFYAGVIDGYKPKCNCRKIAEVKAAQAEKVANTNSDDFWYQYDEYDLWSQYTEEYEVSDFVATKDRSKSVRRRINRAKANKKAVGILPIVEAKVNKIPVKGSTDDAYFIADKKCGTTKRAAKHRYQLNIAISFPDIPVKKYGRRLWHMIDLFKTWQHTATYTGNTEMVIACKNAIATLDTAMECGGELSSLHREGNVLHVRVGFLDKISMLNFKKNTSSNN